MTETRIGGKRPLAVTLSGWWMGVYGASLSLFYAMAFISSSARADFSPQPVVNAPLVIVSVIVSLATFATGFGVLKRQRWAYWLTLTVQILNIIIVGINAFPFLSNGSRLAVPLLLLALVVILISLAILAYFGFGEGRALLKGTST